VQSIGVGSHALLRALIKGSQSSDVCDPSAVKTHLYACGYASLQVCDLGSESDSLTLLVEPKNKNKSFRDAAGRIYSTSRSDFKAFHLFTLSKRRAHLNKPTTQTPEKCNKYPTADNLLIRPRSDALVCRGGKTSVYSNLHE
jgi:hypothetical protein